MSQPTSTFDDPEPLAGDADASDLPNTPAPPVDPYEGAVPPGYDWPTHGGYLGCLLGLMLACIVGGFLGSLVDVFDFEHHIKGLPNVLIVLATFLLALALLSRIGWLLGRRYYREYAAKPTWGESDAYQPEWRATMRKSGEDNIPDDTSEPPRDDAGPA